jgi:hypothetical protein
MVGNYDIARPSGAVLEYTLYALAVMCRKIGLGPTTINFHRDYAQKTCPGLMVTREWFLPLLAEVAYWSAGLPSDETAQDAGTLVEKARWWVEEWTRWNERGYAMRARDIQLSLIDLMYRAERAAKGAGV